MTEHTIENYPIKQVIYVKLQRKTLLRVPEKKLVWRTNEGFKVQPFYRQEDLQGLDTETKPGEFPYKRGTKACNSWYVRQGISTKDIKEANAKALDILNKGVDSLNFCCRGRLIEGADLEALLDGILADCIELNFSTKPQLACAQAQASRTALSAVLRMPPN